MIHSISLFLRSACLIITGMLIISACGKKQDGLMGNRFLTFNTVIRVNQIEVSRDRNEGFDEHHMHTPERVVRFRDAIEEAFPGSRITWAFSWLALHDTTVAYRQIRELVKGYISEYGDEMTFIPGGYFANAYNSTEQVNRDIHDALELISGIVGNGYRPRSIVSGFLSAKNQQYLAEEEDIHVCQGNIWSQYAIDNQDGEGSVSYPYYPSKEHFCKPAQGKSDFIDCVNLDGWTMDFIAARREGFRDGFNSRMGVGPIETVMAHGLEKGISQMMHTTAAHFDRGFDLNGFAWVTNCWELCLMEYNDIKGLREWLSGIKERWPDTRFITQGEFGEIWRAHYRRNDFDYRFEQTGSGIGGSDAEKKIRWFMNPAFRLALLSEKDKAGGKWIIDFTRYDIPVSEPESGSTRNWSLMGEINQKQTRQQDKPVPLNVAGEEMMKIIGKKYPGLTKEIKDIPAISHNETEETVVMSLKNGNLAVRLNYSGQCVIDLIKVNGTCVCGSNSPVFSGFIYQGKLYSSKDCSPVVKILRNRVIIDSINYGPAGFPVSESWELTVEGDSLFWTIKRNYQKEGTVDDNFLPCFQFSSMDMWDGALLDNGGVAWNRFLSNEGESFGTHSDSFTLWHRKDNRCLKVRTLVSKDHTGVITFRHQPGGTCAVVRSVAAGDIDTRYGLFRFLTGNKKVFAPFEVERSSVTVDFVLSSAFYDQEYDRGELKGVDENSVIEMFNTIGRYGVVDRNLYGSNGWRTGWVVLQEPWLALYGLGNNFPEFIKGFAGAIDHAADKAVLPDGRVLPRWHHDATDAMPGTYLENGFYECQWGYMLDSQPAFVINVAEQFDLTGDTVWLKRLKPVCEHVLEYMIARDKDNDGLTEVVQESWKEAKGADWLDVIWVAHEVSTINALMYMALVRWSELEKLMGEDEKAEKYRILASRLKDSYNRTTEEGGFWDSQKECYVHWREADGKSYGNNLNTVVNFLAIGYGLCDDSLRIRAVLDRTEELMQLEKLFIWPSCFYPYPEGFGLHVNYPWPNYENGDMFLAWAELGTRCYARYKPEIALKYIRNVMKQYETDGLSYQRYTRIDMSGAGDDILSNNVMALTGLYRNLYGIRPKFNRLYIEPRLTPDLYGTQLKYSLRGLDYLISLDEGSYSAKVKNYTAASSSPFAVATDMNSLLYFHGSGENRSMKVTCRDECNMKIGKWTNEERSWIEKSAGKSRVSYEIYDLEPSRIYKVESSPGKTREIKSDSGGMLRFTSRPGNEDVSISLKAL